MKPPEISRLYTSSTTPGVSVLVEDVTEIDDCFLVSIIDPADRDNPQAVGTELTSDEWFEMVEQFGLISQ